MSSRSCTIEGLVVKGQVGSTLWFALCCFLLPGRHTSLLLSSPLAWPIGLLTLELEPPQLWAKSYSFVFNEVSFPRYLFGFSHVLISYTIFICQCCCQFSVTRDIPTLRAVPKLCSVLYPTSPFFKVYLRSHLILDILPVPLRLHLSHSS